MTQTQRILEHLRTHPGGLTQMDAYRLGMGTRLAARISDARELLAPGERIVTLDERHDGGTHARYVLIDDSRIMRTIADWERFGGSPHERFGHVKPVPGCEWCIRWAAVDTVFRNAEAPVAEDVVEPTLWDCGEVG